MSSESDRLLIRDIRAGDQRAWEQLISRYEGRLLAFAIRRLRDRAASEDIVQETFVGFLHSLPNFDEKRELQTWLFTIAAYKITDYLRKMGRALGQLIDHWRKQGEYQRIQVLELLFVKGSQNKDAAKCLKISEQQVANIRFAAVKKLSEQIRASGLPVDVFPELKEMG
jgi:RNA polymerase sigma-70 factor, ECF subfamily